jgi:type II secretory pathway pseudopilin PulG
LTCSRKRNAFTLLESLITVLLVSLVFGLIAELLISSFRVTEFERQKMEAAEGAQLALNRILGESREACRIDTSVFPNEIILYKFNPAHTLDARADSSRYNYLLKVRYYLDPNGTLLRDVTDMTAGTTDTHLVMDHLAGRNFAEDPNTKNIQVSLSVSINGKNRTYSGEVAPMAYVP